MWLFYLPCQSSHCSIITSLFNISSFIFSSSSYLPITSLSFSLSITIYFFGFFLHSFHCFPITLNFFLLPSFGIDRFTILFLLLTTFLVPIIVLVISPHVFAYILLLAMELNLLLCQLSLSLLIFFFVLEFIALFNYF